MKKIAFAFVALAALSSTAFASSRDSAAPLGNANVPSVESAVSTSAMSNIAMNGEANRPLTRYERDSKLASQSAS